MPDFANLQSFRHRVPFCSQSALAAILTLAKEEGIPECHKRKDIRSSVQQLVQSLQLYGPLLITISALTVLGESEPLVFGNIFSYLAGAYAAGGAFAKYFEKHMQSVPVLFPNLGSAYYMLMSSTQETSWPVGQEKHGPCTFPLLNLAKICPSLTFGLL